MYKITSALTKSLGCQGKKKKKLYPRENKCKLSLEMTKELET